MRVVHIVGGDLNGGASKGALLLHEALLEKGVDSLVVCNAEPLVPDAGGKFFPVENGIWAKIKGWAFRKHNASYKLRYPNRESTVFNAGLSGANILSLLTRLEPDVVHLHWIGHAVFDIRKIRNLNCTVVWTLRDMWAFTGGCHYSLQCDKYKVGCGSCSQLNSRNATDVTRKNCEQKKNVVSGVVFVGISEWLVNIAKSSYVLKDVNKIHRISNGINTDIFFPVDKACARTSLNLPLHGDIISVGAQNLRDSYKGFGDAVEALNILSAERDILVVVFGRVEASALANVKFKWISLGYISSDSRLRDLYSASNVYLAPSKMEAFGKTVAEAMACGTPVVCYDSSGPKDIVVHGLTGYLAKSFDTGDLANGLAVCLGDPDMRPKSDDCRRVVEKEFSVRTLADRYIDLYEKSMHLKVN